MVKETEKLLQVKELAIHFPSKRGIVRAVDGVSWSVNRGETLAILGESGSGKSVSASAVLNLVDAPPARIAGGEILYLGRDLMRMSRRERMAINGCKISMIFQDPLAALNPVYPIGRQIAETLIVHGHDPAYAKGRAIELLARVGIDDPERRAQQYPHQFSGGQRQRIMIASAIALEPDLLIADEPTSALDVTVQSQVLKLLKEIQAETGMGIVLITHDLTVVQQVADRVVVMNAGKVVEAGTADEIMNNPQQGYTKKLIAALPGKGDYCIGPEVHNKTQTPLLEVKDVFRLYGVSGDVAAVRAVDGMNLRVLRGETLGIVGESGSGKSTLARMMLGLDQPTSGDILFDGNSLLEKSNSELRTIRRRMQFIFQDPTASLNPRMRAVDIVSEPWAIHKDVLPKQQWRKRAQELLEMVGLQPDHLDRFPHQFSGGQRQRIAIARSLALNPELIVCDEAVSALDVSVQAQVIDLLRRLREELGLTYIFIAHDLYLVRDFATRVAVTFNGKIVENNSTEALYTSPQNEYTRQLLKASGIGNVALTAAQ
jgi:peptide/nickel transport system ATP-binding protein